MATPASTARPSRLGRGCVLVAALLTVWCTAAVPAVAVPAAKPDRAAVTKPLVFMGVGTLAGLTVLASAGLVAGARRRRGTAPPSDPC
ncbi:hypothetical protein ACH4CC_21890 [Streptomyces lydicus]|uniref:hypothetical protein n=1 Tax=Streptomyces lydicus TaxID=47763 RepID=UPI00378ACB36